MAPLSLPGPILGHFLAWNSHFLAKIFAKPTFRLKWPTRPRHDERIEEYGKQHHQKLSAPGLQIQFVESQASRSLGSIRTDYAIKMPSTQTIFSANQLWRDSI